MRANSLMIAGGLIGLGASILNRAAAQKVIMLPDTYITGKLETPPRSRLRAERLHRLRPGLREGQRPAHREKCGGPARTHHRGLARDELRDARARASRRARQPGARNRSAGHRGAAALSPARDHAAAGSVRRRRRSDGRGGRLPDLQHPGGRRAQGGGGAAARVKTCPSSVFSIHWAPALRGDSRPDARPRFLRMTSRLGLWLLLAVFTAGWFCNLGYRHLFKPDEGRYAEIPREMAASGDWLTPRLNGFKYFEKPALQYWATAAAFGAFGQNEWAARLWPGLAGFFGVLLVFWTGNRLFGPPIGLYGALVAASSAMYVLIGHFLSLDMALAFFMSASVFAIALAQRDESGDDERRRWMLLAWAAAALAVLSKGLVGIVLPAGAVVLYVLIERDRERWARLHLLPGGLLFLAITAPWFVAVSLANPEFFRFFFIHEHVERFLTREHDRYEPAWYFVPVLLLGIVPWIVSLFPALWSAWARSPGARFQPRRFLFLWCAVVFAFFSASSSKLGSYILPMFPALALLVGHYLVTAGARIAVAQAAVAA